MSDKQGADDKPQGPWLAQIGFAVLAGLAVYGFVDMAKHAEVRRSCEPLVQLRPQYMGNDRSAPDFDLPALGGGRVKLSDHAGKVVILHFWTKTCKPCLEELPLLAQFADNFRAAAAALPAPEGAATGAAAESAAPPAVPRKNEINALAIVWGLIKGWLAGLFGKRPA